MERCSILFNTTDFCLVIFSGNSQQTWQIKRICFERGRHVQLCTLLPWATVEGLRCCIWWERALAFFSWGSVKICCFSQHKGFPPALFFLLPTAKNWQGFLFKQFSIKAQGYKGVTLSAERLKNKRQKSSRPTHQSWVGNQNTLLYGPEYFYAH